MALSKRMLNNDRRKKSQALTASQLCLKLLETNIREELCRLLTFMAVAANPDGYKLQKQSDNRTVVCKVFAKAIVQNKSLTKSQTEELVTFLVDNHADLFKTPATLLEKVGKKLHSLQEGGDPDAIADFAFCQRLDQDGYEEQKQQTTAQQLRQLMDEISCSAVLPGKEKKKLLKEFQKHHPAVFLQHFSTVF
nr:PREDICTED: DEP domain-containing protein 7-like [Latimeria chalumnae]|eukprot:XP_014341204.1 PREDICTED: DEP domain-containing protein 7-like [Latimeria chalumnae]